MIQLLQLKIVEKLSFQYGWLINLTNLTLIVVIFKYIVGCRLTLRLAVRVWKRLKRLIIGNYHLFISLIMTFEFILNLHIKYLILSKLFSLTNWFCNSRVKLEWLGDILKRFNESTTYTNLNFICAMYTKFKLFFTNHWAIIVQKQKHRL